MRKVTTFLAGAMLMVAASLAQAQSPLAAAISDLERDFESLMALPSTERMAQLAEVQRNLSSEDARQYRRAFKRNREALQTRMQSEPELAAFYKDLYASRKETIAPPRATAPRPKIPGTNIQYDTGVVAGTAGVASQMMGNRFDSALNVAGTQCCFPVETTGTITQITFNMVSTAFNSVVFSIYSNIVGTQATQVTSRAKSGISTGLNTVLIGTGGTANVYQNGPFLAGFWQFSPGGGGFNTQVGLDTNTTGGQGFHAISMNDGAVGTGLTTVTLGGGQGANAILRIRGNVATPVELLNFSID